MIFKLHLDRGESPPDTYMSLGWTGFNRFPKQIKWHMTPFVPDISTHAIVTFYKLQI